MFKVKKELKAIKKFRNKENEVITFDELSEIPINETIQLYPKLKGAVEYTRIQSYNDNLVFTVSMMDGQLWQQHSHDCKETILVYRGLLNCLLLGKKASRLQNIVFEPYQNHCVVSKGNSIFYVEFENPNK